MAGRVVILLLLFCSCNAMEDTDQELVLSFMRHSGTSAIVAFICPQQGHLSVSKFFSSNGLSAQVFDPDKSFDLSAVLGTKLTSLAVLVDVSCDGSQQLLREASDARLFSRLHHWLLLGPLDALYPTLQGLLLPLDSQVTAASRDPDCGCHLLRDIYHTGVVNPLVITETESWMSGEVIQQRPPRDNWVGLQLDTVIVVVEDDWSQTEDLNRKHLNTWTKLNFALMRLVAAKLNFTMKLVFTNTWGYLINGSFNGMTAILQRQEAEVGAAGMAIKEERMVAVDYTAETVPFWPRFLFRSPPLSAVTNIYTLPFTRTVWATYLTTLLVLTFILINTELVMNRVHPSDTADGPPPQWNDTLLLTFSILCDEGYPETPQWLSSRIVLLFLLVLSVFHLTSYSACIVSLLQTTSTEIDTLSELLDSPLKLAMQDIPYNVNFDNETNDPLVHKFYHERIYSQPRQRAFISLEEGVEHLRTGLFAFHVDVSAYKLVGETFMEHEKCGLKVVPMFPWQVLSIPVRKGSPYREHITRSLRWLKETGLMDREWRRWTTQKPECQNRESGFVSVGLQEFYPVLAVIATGLLGAGLLLPVEMLLYGRHCHLHTFRKPKVMGYCN